MPAPRNYSYAPNEIDRIRSHFADRLHRPCLIVGNGPSSATAELTPEETANSVIFRMNWFFLEEQKTYGTRVDGFFCAIQNNGLEERLEDIVRGGCYDIGAYFQPFISTDDSGLEATHSHLRMPAFDHWALIASNPTLARFMMGRPLPTQGMQVLAFAAALGFKDIRLSGIDMYAATAQRYAWQVPEDVRVHLKKKDVAVGYEEKHSLELDLMFLRAIRKNFEFRLSGITKLDLLAPFLDDAAVNKKAAPAVKAKPTAGKIPHVYATYVEGDYVLGACALSRSLKKVSNTPLIVLYSRPDVALRLKHLDNVILKKIEPLDNPHNHGQARFAATYNKLRVFELIEYDRVVFVDSDCIFLQNADELFETDGFCAAPNWGFELKDDFNSGVFAFSPSAELRDRVIGGMDAYSSSDGGDQGYLNALFGQEWAALPPEYNTLKRLLVHHPALVNLSDVKILHYVGRKPWDLSEAQEAYLFLVPYWSKQLDSSDWNEFFWIAKSRAKRSNDGRHLNRLVRASKNRILQIGKRLVPENSVPAIKTVLRKVGLY